VPSTPFPTAGPFDYWRNVDTDLGDHIEKRERSS
jgi:hypothetical protein